MITPPFDQELEAISEQIRRGIPVGVFEALQAISYQEELRKYREQNSIFGKLKRLFKVKELLT